MKYTIKRKIFLDATLDSSEMVMFTKGGKHKIELPLNALILGDDDSDLYELEISVQMERSEQARFDFVTSKPKVTTDYINET